jgi:serine/threonine-protein kinase
MSNKIGRFEIVSEITHSDRGSIYKATDTESGKTVTLKTLRLDVLGEQAPALVATMLQEAEASKVLNSPNIALLYGASEIDGAFCADLEYVQGNSVATMLARKEGFSIWDLMDIARQTCQGLDHADAKKVVHHTLEPAKIMVTWDGTVKVLGFGISTMSAFAAQASGVPAEVLYYMSPEQIAGDPLDGRSNIFSLGAILYEMVTERKAFNGEDADQVRQAIQGASPVSPDQVNRKLHPALSQLIMKALAKNPDERYATGQDLVNDLERCKESTTKAAAKTPAKIGVSKPPSGIAQPTRLGASAPGTATPRQTAPAQQAPITAPAAKASMPAPVQTPETRVAAKAAAAGASSTGAAEVQTFQVQAAESPAAISTGQAIEPELMASAAVDEPAVQTPKTAFDPMMDESRQTSGPASRSFSEIDELPPLKEVRITTPAPAAPQNEPEPSVQAVVFNKKEPEKPRIQPREAAKKAMKEIKKTPPQLFIYSIAAAVVVILAIVGMIAYHIHSENADEDTPPAATPAESTQTANAAPVQASAPATAAVPVQATSEASTQDVAPVSVKPRYTAAGKKKQKIQAPVAAVVVPGQLSVSSTPAGAQIQVDGQSNAAWVTPYDISGLSPGQHSVAISKPGFATDTRTIDVASGSKSFVSIQLAQLAATVTITSDPTGAEVWMDGRDTGKATPAQISVDKPGSHSFIFKKQGYLDETTSANLQVGQISHLTPTLRALGSTDDIRMGGKFKKMFGGSDTAGMGSIAVKTQPKGAQIAVNNRILDKPSPAEFYLNPGNYVVDITLSGFQSIHRVVTVDKSGKVVIDEIMNRE